MLDYHLLFVHSLLIMNIADLVKNSKIKNDWNRKNPLNILQPQNQFWIAFNETELSTKRFKSGVRVSAE